MQSVHIWRLFFNLITTHKKASSREWQFVITKKKDNDFHPQGNVDWEPTGGLLKCCMDSSSDGHSIAFRWAVWRRAWQRKSEQFTVRWICPGYMPSECRGWMELTAWLHLQAWIHLFLEVNIVHVKYEKAWKWKQSQTLISVIFNKWESVWLFAWPD